MRTCVFVDVESYQGRVLWTHPTLRFWMPNEILINTIIPKVHYPKMLHTLLSLFMSQDRYTCMEFISFYAYWVVDIVWLLLWIFCIDTVFLFGILVFIQNWFEYILLFQYYFRSNENIFFNRAAVRRVYHMKGEAVKSMTLGELAEDLR